MTDQCGLGAISVLSAGGFHVRGNTWRRWRRWRAHCAIQISLIFGHSIIFLRLSTHRKQFPGSFHGLKRSTIYVEKHKHFSLKTDLITYVPILKGALYYRAALLALCGSFAVRMLVLVIEFVDGFRYVPINIAVRHLKVTFRRRAHSVPFLHLELKSVQAGRGKHSKAQVLSFPWFHHKFASL